jgi:hypothetical protein
MEQRIRTAMNLGVAAVLAGSALSGCATKDKAAAAASTVQSAPATTATAAGSAVAPVTTATSSAPNTVAQALEPKGSSDKPGGLEGELLVIDAKVKAIDTKNRVVTLKFPDGKESKVKCGPEVRNFPQIRVGDDVRAEFLETVELFVTDPQGKPKAEKSNVVERAPKGDKPGIVEVETVEVSAIVDSIDYKTRNVKLKGPEGKLFSVKAGPDVKRLDEVKKGDTVVARLTNAVSIRVSAPK